MYENKKRYGVKPSLPIKYTIRDFFPRDITNTDYKKTKNDKKLRKMINPILLIIAENSESENERRENDVLLTLNKLYESLPAEYKEQYIGKQESLKDQVNALSTKLDAAKKEALDFIKSLRNMLMHSPKTEEAVFNKFRFNKVDGSLFDLFKLALKMEMIGLEKYISTHESAHSTNTGTSSKNPLETSSPTRLFVSQVKNKELKDQIIYLENLASNSDERILDQIAYWKKIALFIDQMNSTNLGEIPYIYAFASIALYADIKDMQEMCVLLKTKGYFNRWILQFCIKGSYKVITPGIYKEDTSLELHRIQLHREKDIREHCLNTNKHITRDYDFFLEKGKLKPEPAPSNIGTYYQKLLRYYSFSHSFPTLPQYEDQIKQIKAERLSKARLEKKANVQKIIDERLYRGLAPELPKADTNVDTIKASFTNVFRQEDVFMREVMAFLGDVDSTWFGQNWQIRENTVLWQDPYSKIEFDIRRKTKPSKNALSSIYPMVYKKDIGEHIASLSRTNLTALLVAILLNKGNVDFPALYATAKMEISAPKSENPNNKEYWEKLAKESGGWNKHEQASLVIKYIRKYIPKHFHLQDSIMFHQNLLQELYSWDGSGRSLQSGLQEAFTPYGITIPNEIIGIFRAKNLEALVKIVCEEFVDPKAPKNKSGEKTHVLFRTWNSYAFTPSKNIDPSIKDALKWEENVQGDFFEVLLGYFDKNNYTYPDIVSIYLQDKGEISLYKLIQSMDKKALKKERATRDMLAEELLLECIAFYYVEKIKGESSYMELKAISSSDKKSPIAFNIVWNLKPPLEVSLEDYNKKNIKQILNWVFDPRRMGIEISRLDNTDSVVLAQNCYGVFDSSARFISQHKVLGAKAPNDSYRYEGSQETLDLENKFNKIKWFQREMIAQICDIENKLIWEVKDFLDEIESKESYYNFTKLVNLYKKHKKLENDLDSKIIAVRNMLAHGYLLRGKMNVKSIIDTIEEFNTVLGRKSLYDYYNPLKNRY